MMSISAWAYDKRQWWLTDIIDGIKGSGYAKLQYTHKLGNPRKKAEEERYRKLVQSHKKEEKK